MKRSHAGYMSWGVLLIGLASQGCLSSSQFPTTTPITKDQVDRGLQRQREVDELRSKTGISQPVKDLQKGTGYDDRARDIERKLGYK